MTDAIVTSDYAHIVQKLVEIRQGSTKSVLDSEERIALEQGLMWPPIFYEELFEAVSQHEPDELAPLTMPDEECEAKAIQSGLSVLSDAEIAAVVLNQLALCSLQGRIDDELPQYWLDQMWDWAVRQTDE